MIREISHSKPAAIVHLDTGSISGGDGGPSVLVIAGLALASLLFFGVAAVPAAGTRSTLAGRIVGYHKTELLVAGLGTLLLTAMAFFITRGR